MPSHVSIILDPATKIGSNKYKTPDMRMREYNLCKLVSAYYTNTQFNIRDGRKLMRVTFPFIQITDPQTNGLIPFRVDLYIAPGSYSSQDLVNILQNVTTPNNQYNTFASQVEAKAVAAGITSNRPQFYGDYDTRTNKVTFISSTPFYITQFIGSYGTHMGEIFGIGYSDVTNSIYTGTGNAFDGHFEVDAYKYTALNILNPGCDKTINVFCNTIRTLNLAVCSIRKLDPFANNREYYEAFLKEKYMVNFPIDTSADGSIVDLSYPRVYESIFKYGATEFELYFPNGEPCDLQGGYLILSFEVY